MKLAVDAMGSDQGSRIVIAAVRRFIRQYPDELYVYGGQNELKELAGLPRVTIIPTSEVMEMTDGPLAVRRKKDSSMIRAISDLRDGKVDGLVSCGSTGALLSGGMMLIKPIDKIERAAILTLLPTKAGRPAAILDIGANAANTPEQLRDFAILGRAYMQADQQIANPKVALLNIGTESEKGDALHKAAYVLLAGHPELNFIGNIESGQLLEGTADVIVADGFSGNIALKCMEGTSKFLMGQIKHSLMGSFWSKLGAMLAKESLRQVKDLLNPQKYGGALIAGLNSAIVKAHGSSDEIAMYHAIEQLRRIVGNQVIAKIREQLA